MTAKEIFEALGYANITSNKRIITWYKAKENGEYITHIVFDDNEYMAFNYNAHQITPAAIYKELNAAIQQQLKELGWQ